MNIDKIVLNGNTYDIQDVTSGYSNIEIENLLSSGVVLGTITLNGSNYIIYAPNESTQGGLDVNIGGNELILTNMTGES